jgi:hypothetical protein
VPLDFRLLIFGLDGESSFAGFRSESTDEKDEALIGGELDVGGCRCDCDGEEVGMGDEFEADIAASLLCSCVHSKDSLCMGRCLEERMLKESVEVVVGLVEDLFNTR